MSHDIGFHETVCIDNDQTPRERVAEYLSNQDSQTEWSNHWDINPDRHGGCFVRFDGSDWVAIVTTPPDSMPADLADGRHLFERFYVEPADIWELDELPEIDDATLEMDPYAGLTDEALRFVDQYSGPAQCPMETTFDHKGAKSFAFDFHSYYGAAHLGGKEMWVDDDDYWQKLERLGVETDEFR